MSSTPAARPDHEQGDGPLSDVVVLDLTSVLFGPYATHLLGEMGADVIKVESPGGDVLRTIGPSRHHGMSSIFLTVGRAKRSIAIDLTQGPGREVLLRLAAHADVFIHSMRPRAIAKLGLTYADVMRASPDIIYCNAIGFGRDGRYADRPAYDDVIQGATGFAAAQASHGGAPQYIATPIADKTAGLAACNAILAALHYRSRTGSGQELEVPMFETLASYFLTEHMWGEAFSPPIGSTGYQRLLSKHRKPYRTQDGYICVLIYNDKQWTRFFSLIGRPELLDDPRFGSIAMRTEHIDALYELLAAELQTRTTAEWLGQLDEVEIPALPLADTEMVLNDPHLADVGFFQVVEHPTEGLIRTTAFPTRFSRSPAGMGRQAPRLGEHTDEILRRAGVSEQEIDELASQGVVTRADPKA